MLQVHKNKLYVKIHQSHNVSVSMIALLLIVFSYTTSRAEYGEWLKGLTAAQFNGLPNSQMYDAAEFYRLSKNNLKARKTYEILLGRDSNGEYADRSRLELGKLCLIVSSGFKESIAYFTELKDNSQEQEYRDEAQYYLDALTDPSSVDDIALLEEISLQYVVEPYDSSNNMPNQWFICKKIEKCFRTSETLVLINNSDWSDEEKCSVIMYGAVSCFRAGNASLAFDLCDAVLSNRNYAQYNEIMCYLSYLKGHILAQQFNRLEEGIEVLEAGANNYPDAAFADRCLYQAAENSFLLHRKSDAKYYYQRLINNYPHSFFYDSSEHMMTTNLNEIELSEAQIKKLENAEVREANSGPQQEINTELQKLIKGANVAEPTGLRKYCGPVVLAEVLRSKGEQLTYEEAYQLCLPDKNGFTTMSKLVEALKTRGCKVQALELGLNNLKQAFGNHAVILHFGDHFTVLRKIESEHYVIFDDRGEIRLTPKRFKHLWDGYAILIETASKQEQIKNID